MPYVAKAKREAAYSMPLTPGELNFSFTQHALDYLERRGLSYDSINEVMGAFDCAAREFYRRVAAPYEDIKRAENGDVYPDVRPRTQRIHIEAPEWRSEMTVPDLEGRDL